MARLLILDDERGIRVSLQVLLSSLGHEVFLAENLAQARAIIDSNPLDVLLTDYVIGKENGLEILEYVREKQPDVQAIIATGHPTLETTVQAMRLGAFDCLAKPIGGKAMEEAVGRAVDRKAQLDRMKRELVESEARYQRLTESAQDLIWRTDFEGNVVYVNPAVEKLLGFSVQEACGRPERDYLSPDSIEKMRQWIKESLTEKPRRLSFRGEVEYLRKKGKPLLMELNVTLVPDAQGRIVALEGISRDITEQKKMEQSLKESEERYRVLVERAPLGILRVNLDGTIESVNLRLVEILGSPSAQATRAINVLTFPPLVQASIADDVRRCLDTGEKVVAEHPYLSKWGKETFLRFHLTALRDSADRITGALGIVEDISESKEIEREKLQLVQRLNQPKS